MINGYGPYYYRVHSEWNGGKVRQVHEEYLGKNYGAKAKQTVKTDNINERRIKEGLKSSEKETLGEGSLDWVRSSPGSGQVLFGVGEEKIIKENENIHEIYYEKTNNLIFYKSILTESTDGKAGRILIVKTKRVGPESPNSNNIVTKEYKTKDGDAGLLWRKINGKPTIVDVNVDASSRGKGLGSASVNEFEKEYGGVRVKGPYSKQGKSLIEKYPEGIEVI